MRIRNIIKEDSVDLFQWRNDLITREMFIDQKEISLEEHSLWFKKSMTNPDIDFYIGEIESNKLGVCRFDYDKKLNQAIISINMNPEFRGKGLGEDLLKNVINEYKKKRKSILIAQIKELNFISKKLFSSVGFKIINKLNNIVYMEKRDKLTYKKVEATDCELLYKLLKQREFNISHKIFPDYENHRIFVRDNPYLKWYIIYLFDQALGTFYIQYDNSIGININNPSKSIINELFDFILKNFSPRKEVSSLIPSYFFVNVANTNKDLIDIINSLDLKQIQVTFKLSK